jgi:hypothetical protein
MNGGLGGGMSMQDELAMRLAKKSNNNNNNNSNNQTSTAASNTSSSITQSSIKFIFIDWLKKKGETKILKISF